MPRPIALAELIDLVNAGACELVEALGPTWYEDPLASHDAHAEAPTEGGRQSDLMSDFANVWQAADKVVYSTTLAAVSTANSRLERHDHFSKGTACSGKCREPPVRDR